MARKKDFSLLLLGKYKSRLQEEYEKEVEGKSDKEKEDIQTKYLYLLNQMNQRILALHASALATCILLSQEGKNAGMENFLSEVRRENYGDEVTSDRVFCVSYFDDVMALLDRAIFKARIDSDYMKPCELPQSQEKRTEERALDDKRLINLEARKQKLKSLLEFSESDLKKMQEECRILATQMASMLKLKYSNSSDFEGKIMDYMMGGSTYRTSFYDKWFDLQKKNNVDTDTFESIKELIFSCREKNLQNETLNQLFNEERKLSNGITIKKSLSDILKEFDELPSKIDEIEKKQKRLELLMRASDELSIEKIVELTLEEVRQRVGDVPNKDERIAEELELIVSDEEKFEKRGNVRFLEGIIRRSNIDLRKELLGSYAFKTELVSSYLAQILDISEGDAAELYSTIRRNLTVDQKQQIKLFEIESLDRSSEELELIVQLERIKQLFGRESIEAKEDGLFLFRAGDFDIEQTMVSARVPYSSRNFTTHVAHGSKGNKFETPFLSTTKDPVIMSIYLLAEKAKESTDKEPATPMVIDCLALYKIMSERLQYMQTQSVVIKNEEEFLKILGETHEISTSDKWIEKINERLNAISRMPLYERDSNLPTMMHPVFSEKITAQDVQAIEAVVGERSANSIKEIGKDRRDKKVLGYGKSSLEVLIKNGVPITYTSPLSHEKTTVTHEMDLLQMDFIQTLLMSNYTLSKFIRMNQETPMLDILNEILLESEAEGNSGKLSKSQIRFARDFYLKRKPISEIFAGDLEEESFPDIKEHIRKPEEKIELANIMREGIIEKILLDRRIQYQLMGCGIKPEKENKILPLLVKKTADTSKIDREEKKDNLKRIVLGTVNGEEVVVGIIGNTKMSLAEEKARDYYKLLKEFEQEDISI